MKYYSEEQVIIMLRNQRDICSLIINGNNSNNWQKTRLEIYKTREPKFPLYKFNSVHMDSDNWIRLRELKRLRENLQIKGLQTRTVLEYRITELESLLNH